MMHGTTKHKVHRMRIYENMMIFLSKEDKETRNWRKLGNVELHEFYSSQNIISVMFSL
jgi:hypothetical protein